MAKVDIFSGFLGAGKTTLIKKLIEEAPARCLTPELRERMGALSAFREAVSNGRR